jgi:hypothetical protein
LIRLFIHYSYPITNNTKLKKMEPSLQNLNKAAVNNGLILGALSVVIGLVTYYMFPSMLGSIPFGIGMAVISILIYVFFTLDLRKKIGGYWSFREALKGIFLMAFIAGIVYAFVNLVFYKFIEPDAIDKVSGIMEEGTASTMERLGVDQDAIDEAVNKQREALKAQYDPTAMEFIKNLGVPIIIQFVMSLIFAAIFKKEAPVFAPVDDQE